jgi:hypothetical protein
MIQPLWAVVGILAAAGEGGSEPLLGALDAIDQAGHLGDGSLVLFDEPRSGQTTRVVLGGRVNAPPATLIALIGEAKAYKTTIPAFVRVDIEEERGRDKLVAWEVEVPLWNLEGKLWLKPRADGVDLEIVEGHFAPASFRISARPARGARTTDPSGKDVASVLVVEARANVRDVNFLTRRLARRTPLMEPAMTATATWVLLRAFTLEAEARAGIVRSRARRNPKAAMVAPPTASFSADAACDGLAAAFQDVIARGAIDRRALGLVLSRTDGRLDRILVAATARHPPDRIASALGIMENWRALPGWRRITKAEMADGSRTLAWQVDSNLTAVDFDAIWEVTPGPPFRARSSGDWEGAALGWDLFPGARPRDAAAASTALFSIHPRLDKAGYVPRKFIEAEPLLEHGLALGVAYVDALSLLRALEKR